MASRADLNEINELNQELSQIEQALHNFDLGGSILSLTVGGARPDEMPYNPIIHVPTAYMTYPPQMVAAIKAMLEDRRKEIAGRLAGLGLTDIQPEPQDPGAAPHRRRSPPRA